MRILLVFIAVLAADPAWSKGSLVIVGGGLSADNAEIYRAFIDSAQGGKIAIVPSASGEPQASLDAFAANLVRHGVEPSLMLYVRIAEVDDLATAEDESAWASNDDNLAEIAKIEQAKAIWFTGGDDTAIFVDLGTRRASVIGRGSVTVVKNKNRVAPCDGRSAMFGLGVYRAGQKFRLLK